MAKLTKLYDKLYKFFTLSKKKREEKCDKLKKIVKDLKNEKIKLKSKNPKKAKDHIKIIDKEIEMAQKIIQECENNKSN